MKRTHINAAANPDGTRNVTFLHPDGNIPAGKLMPEVTNHAPEQPTNRYKRVLIERARKVAPSDHGAAIMHARRTQFHA